MTVGIKKMKGKADEFNSETGQQLKLILETKLSEKKDDAATNILQSQTETETKPKSSAIDQPNLLNRIKSKAANWYWIMIALTIGSAITVLAIGEEGLWTYIRYISASILVLFLPGYAFLRTLSPSNARNLRETNRMGNLTRLTLSIVLSIVMVSVLGLILDQTPMGVTLNSLVMSLSLFTLFFSTLALFRELRGI